MKRQITPSEPGFERRIFRPYRPPRSRRGLVPAKPVRFPGCFSPGPAATTGKEVFRDRRTPYDRMKYHVSRINGALGHLRLPITLSKARGRKHVTLDVS